MHLGRGVGPLEAGLRDQEVDRVVDRDLAPMQPDVEDDPAGAPDRVRVHHHHVARVRVEPFLAHHLLAVHRPALDELRRVDERPHDARMPDRPHELQVVARVSLVDARVVERGEVVLAQRPRLAVDRRRHEVEAAERGRPELGRLVVGGEGQDGAHVLGRLDHLERFCLRQRRDAVLDHELSRFGHCLPIAGQSLREVLPGDPT